MRKICRTAAVISMPSVPELLPDFDPSIRSSARATRLPEKLDTIVLDKTGTITRGAPALTDVTPTDGMPELEFHWLVASAEQASDHPLASAIVAGAKKRGLPLAVPADFESLTGKGVRAKVDGHAILVGNERLLEDAGVAADGLADVALRLSEGGKTPMLVAVDRKPAGVLEVADTIKDDSVAAVAALRKLGLQGVMITGDNRPTAAAIARQAGIESVLAEVLPECKAAEVQRLQAEHPGG